MTREQVDKLQRESQKKQPKQPKQPSEPKKPEPKPEPPKPRELVAITDPSVYDSVCNKDRGICILGFLDPSDEAFAGFLGKMSSLATKYQQIPFGWINGPEQPKLVQEFSLADGFPQLFAFFRSKLQVRYFRGGFDLDQLEPWIDETLHTRKRIATLDFDPRFVVKEKNEL